ncbi:MAG TPA: FHA domain-containing protein [Thermoanaerobaculia bacterium]|nr:FHA domain-containing protein [Thermoanaerobaculia bacterium]
MIEDFVVWGIVALMLIVLVPAAFAAGKRLRAPRPSRPPSLSARAGGASPPRKFSEPPTEVVSIDELREVVAPTTPDVGQAATEMMQWYGALVAISGPLQGQRFVITEVGHAIGRDPTESTIVINDKRISKRHVRIVVRRGKVFAIDNGSTNGTFLSRPGGERLTERELRRGDVLVLADNAASFVFQP